ncbi:MAG TPA: hypothetical protein VKU02_21310 [Gemmataceae bacterium]|nr:hypothetical protein [Gemmataceae bacterium]
MGLGIVLCGPEAKAQKPDGPGLPTPRLYVVLPSGGQVGSTFEASVTGTDIEDPQGLLFSQPGIKAEPVAPPPPPPPDPKKPAPKPAPPPNPKFKITIAPDTPIGIHDVRLVNKWGISNPRAFVVGDCAEVMEKEPNNDVPQAQRVELNTTINGVIATPTDVDYFVFAGKRGQRVLASCLASSIDSRLRAGLEVYDSAGRQLAFNRHYHDNDALLDCTLSADGDYYVRLFEFTHTQGSGEHFYRLTLSTAPWIDAVSPIVVEPGKTIPLTVYGRNLPGGQLDPTTVANGCVLEKTMVMVEVPSDPAALQRLAFHGRIPPQAAALDGFEFRLRNAAGTSNPFLLTYARAPVVVSNEMNHSPATAQLIALPCEISGRFTKRRTHDWYTFTAKKGEVYSIEILSERLGALNDMHFTLRRVDTKQELVNLDDNGEVLTPITFYNRTDDPPVYRFVVPADGSYQLMAASHGSDFSAGPRHFYRIRITPELPDFHLIALPSDGRLPDGCCVRQNGDEYYTILVWRHDGFTGPITLTVEGLPTRVTCPPQVIGPNLKQAALVVSAGLNAPEWAGAIKLKGTATIHGQVVVREARPASITWPVGQPQGIPTISRLDRSLVLAVRDHAPFNLTATADQTTVVAGSKIKLGLKLARLWPDFKKEVPVAPIDPATHLPGGLTFANNNQPVTIPADKDDAPPTTVDVKTNVPPGTYNLVLRGTVQVPYGKDAKAKKANATIGLPSNPITLTVLPNQVAKINVNNASPTLKIGAQTELVIKVARLHAYAGAFKVHLVLPPDMKGIQADEIMIPAGEDEAKIVLRAPADATPGNRQNLIVRAIALINGNTPLMHDVKINVNVVK